MISCQYPRTRMRRNRYRKFSRDLVQETKLSTKDLIYPVFIIDQEKGSEPIKSMPSIKRHGLESLVKTAMDCYERKIPAIAPPPFKRECP